MKTETLKMKVWKTLFIVLAVAFGALLPNGLQAQTGTTNKDKMKPLSAWAGKWQGEGWSMDQSRQRTAFTVEENIQWKLDGRVIIAEGIGRNKSDGKVGFHAVGAIYYNNEKGIYEVKSFLDDGNMTLATAEFNDQGQFLWGFDVPGGRVQYTITLTATTWNEKGAFVMPNGQEFPIMEMNLTKAK